MYEIIPREMLTKKTDDSGKQTKAKKQRRNNSNHQYPLKIHIQKE